MNVPGHPAAKRTQNGTHSPVILRDLQDKPSLLVWALPEITGENLTPPRTEDGFLKWNVEAQIDAWLR